MLLRHRHNLPLLVALIANSTGCGDAGRDELQADASMVAQQPPGNALPNSQAMSSGGSSSTLANDSSEVSSEGLDPQPGSSLRSEGLPCEVRTTLAQHCGGCHGESPQFGAPMSLVTREDLTAPSVTDPSRSVYELVMERVRSNTRPMPPAPNERLSPQEVTALSDWIDSGTANLEDLCEGVGPTPLEAGAAYLDTSRCDLQLNLLANDGGNDSGFTVPQEDDHYECFYFEAPIDPVQLLGFRPIIDDSRVLHHWLLYATNNAQLESGTNESCTGIHPNDILLGGWAPGGTAVVMPPDVGLEVPSGTDARFILEIHYNNIARLPDPVDRSGVELCATTQRQEQTAAVHWLGTENIFLLPGESEAGSTCRPNITEPVNIVRITPHMHQLGVHSRVDIVRADGTREGLLDEPFDFNTQVGYDTPALLQPGDTLEASCTWNNSSGGLVTLGEGTNDEMCYLFTLAYPAGALDTGGNFLSPDGFFGGQIPVGVDTGQGGGGLFGGGGLLGGTNKCMN